MRAEPIPRSRTYDILFFVAMLASAMALGGALAHLFELPNKIGLPQEEYFIVQQAYRGWNRLAWLLLVQAINHATEHRTQVAAILTQLGIEPPGMDGWTYHEDQFGGDWSQLWSW